MTNIKKTSGKTTTRIPQANRYSVPVLLSTFRILDELAREDGLSLNEVAQRTSVAKSTAFRILSTLLQLGCVVRSEGHYSFTNRLATLVSSRTSSETIRRIALPFMLQLRNDCGETVNLGVLRLDKVEYIEVVPSEYALRFSEKVGASVMVHASALGKVLLAHSSPETILSILGAGPLPHLTTNTIINPKLFVAECQRARLRGYAFDRGETSADAVCLAVPIVSEDETTVAGLSISGPSTRFNPRKDSPIVSKLQATAREISSQLDKHFRRS